MNEKNKKCRFCSEEIYNTAILCKHCGSFQKRYISLLNSKTIISLLIALISAATLAANIIPDALKKDDSSLILNYINRPDISIPIVASNKGTRPAFISSKSGFAININTNNLEKTFLFSATLGNSTRDNLMIEESESKSYYYFIDKNQYEHELSNLSHFQKIIKKHSINSIESCDLLVSYINFSGKKESIALSMYDRSSNNSIKDNYKLSLLECIGKIPKLTKE